MISVHDALQAVLADVVPIGTEMVPLPAAGGRVLAESVRAGRDVPPFANSAMDGYAVRAADVAQAVADRAVRLRVVETIGAGSVARHAVEPGTAIRIMTGSPMPDGADAVVRVEDTREADGGVDILSAVMPKTSVRFPGEDMRAGEEVLAPGRVLRPADIGLLASLSIAVVRVHRRPIVAILATGDELVDLGEIPGPGQIVNSNAYTIAAAVAEAGGLPRILGIVRDTPEATRHAFSDAFDADMVLSTGGVSVGNFDFVRAALRQLGVVERFWKVAQKPGKPLTFGMRSPTPIFGLPGNPVSSLVCFYLYVRPALRRMQGARALHLRCVEAHAAEDIRTAEGLTEFVRCQLDHAGNQLRVRATGSQSSGVLRSMALGEALAVAPPSVGTIARGDPVRVLLLDGESTATAPF